MADNFIEDFLSPNTERSMRRLAGFEDQTIAPDRVKAIGPLEDLFFGTGAPEDNWLQGVSAKLRGALDSEYNQNRNSRTKLTAEKFLEGFNNLKGGGSITEREGAVAQAALTFLGQEGADEELVAQEMRTAIAIQQKGRFRQRNNIRTDRKTGQEYWTNPKTGEEVPVITVTESDGMTRVYQAKEIGLQIIESVWTDKAKQDFYNGLTNGSRYVYNGKVYTKGNTPDQGTPNALEQSSDTGSLPIQGNNNGGF